MTQKEKLYCKYLELRKELATLKGEEFEISSIDGFSHTERFRHEARLRTIYEWEERIRSYEYTVSRERLEKAIEDSRKEFYATEYGRKEKARMEKAITATRDEWEQYEQGSKESFNNFIKDILGDKWAITRLSTNYLGIAIKKADSDREFYFGQEIEIFYDSKGYREPRFEANIGSCGSFSILDEKAGSFADFYIGVGKLLTDKQAMAELKEALFDYASKIEQYYNLLEQLKEELRNPMSIGIEDKE